MKTLYLVTVWEDIEPQISGPFATERERDQAVVKFSMENEGGAYPLDIDATGKPTIDTYSGAEMDKMTEKEPL